MMNLEDIDEFLSDMSEGVMALVSGVAIIITVTFFIYTVWPLWDQGEAGLFAFSIVALVVTIISSIGLYLSDITFLPDVLGKLITGLTAAIFGVVIFHVANTYGAGALPEVILMGFLGFASALPLTKGVLIPLLGEEEFMTTGEELEDFEEGGFEEDFEGPEETESFETTRETEEEGIDTIRETEDTMDDDEGPW